MASEWTNVVFLFLYMCICIVGFLTTSTLEIRSCMSENGLALPDATLRPVKSTMDVINLMKLGEMRRAIGSTAINTRSSRSHRSIVHFLKAIRHFHHSPATNFVSAACCPSMSMAWMHLEACFRAVSIWWIWQAANGWISRK